MKKQEQKKSAKATQKSEIDVSFYKDAVLKDLSEGIELHLAIKSPDFFIKTLGFAKSEIQHLVKTFRSGERGYGKTIYLSGNRRTAKGVSYYEFLIWFANRLGIDEKAFSEGGMFEYAFWLRNTIISKLQN